MSCRGAAVLRPYLPAIRINARLRFVHRGEGGLAPHRPEGGPPTGGIADKAQGGVAISAS